MQTPAQKLVAVRDQFVLKSLSDDALKQILPAYRQLISNLSAQLDPSVFPQLSAQRQFWLQSQIATIEAQFAQLGLTIKDVLTAKQLDAWNRGVENAIDYVKAAGNAASAPGQQTFAGTTVGGQQVSVAGNLPGFNIDTDPAFVSASNPTGSFIRPSITRQQIAAAQGETGFMKFTTGVRDSNGKWSEKKWTVDELIRSAMKSESNRLVDELRAGFLGGESNDEIGRRVSHFFGGNEAAVRRKTWAMTQAVVRTSMAEASQAAHDAFYEANADLLPKTKSGYRWWWDASNDTRLCPECAPMDGVKYKERSDVQGWPRHFSCRCKILPITATMELLEEEDGPASGSFLERVPVEKDSKGRRKDPPAGYTGENAYKRPMRIDGKLYWVRRQDMGKGETLAGDMLKNMESDEAKAAILGTKPIRHPLTGKEARPVQVWNNLIKQEKYAKDPQSLVRKLLGDPLPPGATAPRPVRGPKPTPVTPKPKAAPKPAAKPLTLEQEGKAFMDKTTPQLNSYLSISRKSEAVMKLRVEAMQAATTPEAKEKARKAYLRASQIEERAYEKTRPAMEALRNQMLKTDLPEKVVKEYVNGVNLTGYGTKRDLKKQVKEHVEEFVRMFNGQGFTPTGPASWVRQIEPDLNGRGFNRGNGTIAARVGNKQNLWHEIMHTVEHQRPWMGELAREWASGRAFAAGDPRLPANLAGKATGTLRGKPVYGLADIQVGTNYRDGEWAWVDNYQNPYMGKYYPNTSEGVVSSEVWTVAVEHFADVRNMHSLFRKHPDLFKMLVGLSQRGR